MASDPVAPMVMAASTALVSAGSVAFSKSRSTLMNSRVPLSPRSASRRRRERGEAIGQAPVLEGPGEVDGTGLSLQEGQVVDRIEGGALFAPVPAVAGDHVGPAADRHLFDPADDADFVVGIGGRHRVVVAVETHEGERVGMALGHPSGLEGLGRQRQHGGAVFNQAFRLGADLAPDPAEQVGITGCGQVPFSAAHDGNDGTGTNRFRRE